MNSVSEQPPKALSHCVYVDDLQISHHGSNLTLVARQLQLRLNKIENWGNKNDLMFSTEKTAAVHFTRPQGVHLLPELEVYGKILPVGSSHTFLRIFDKKLTFERNGSDLRNRCQK